MRWACFWRCSSLKWILFGVHGAQAGNCKCRFCKTYIAGLGFIETSEWSLWIDSSGIPKVVFRNSSTLSVASSPNGWILLAFLCRRIFHHDIWYFHSPDYRHPLDSDHFWGSGMNHLVSIRYPSQCGIPF